MYGCTYSTAVTWKIIVPPRVKKQTWIRREDVKNHETKGRVGLELVDEKLIQTSEREIINLIIH